MTNLSIERDDVGVRVGTRPAHPEHTAVLETQGALLLWDELSPRRYPCAEIHDLGRAADWLWEIYGRGPSEAIRGDAHTIAPDTDAPQVLAAARALAHLHWAEAWWPASQLAEVPPLSTAILRAEAALATAAVDHLLDDDEAVERALRHLDLAPVTALVEDPVLGTTATDIVNRLADLADDHGVELRADQAATPARPDDWTLAAGTSGGDTLTVMTGTTAVDWTRVAPGQVDAAANAAWSVSRRSGTTVVSASIAAAPSTPDSTTAARLRARLGDVEIVLHRNRDASVYSGEAETDSSVLRIAPAHRILQVYSPHIAAHPTQNTDPDAASRRTAIITRARRCLTAEDASLAERAAHVGGQP